tara:strand:+ start:1030 stop:1620 length:591 start_codon:yes stop_codon:yes gene_type:complete
MQGIHHFIVKPSGSRYNNTKKIGDKSLIVNSENQNHEFVNRKGIIVSTPIVNNTNIRENAEVIVHHNVFRRWSDVKGVEKNSKSYFSKDKYIVGPDQIFLYKNDEEWRPLDGFCFVQPLVDEDNFSESKEHPDRGVIVYTDGVYEKGEVVGYTPFSQYEFIIDGQRLFRVYNKFITIKYGHQGNKETYNPSWAQSS